MGMHLGCPRCTWPVHREKGADLMSGKALGAGELEWSSGRARCGHLGILTQGGSFTTEGERKEKLREYSLDVERISVLGEPS